MIRFLKIFFGTVFTLLILIGSCVFYAFKIEPYRIASNQLYLNEKTSDFIKVVQFSDTHIKADFNYKNLDKVVNYINKQNPDVVVFTGDLYDNYAKYHDDEHIIKELQKINATSVFVMVKKCTRHYLQMKNVLMRLIWVSSTVCHVIRET